MRKINLVLSFILIFAIFLCLCGKKTITKRKEGFQLFPFQAENGKWGFRDSTGKIAIQPKFGWADSFFEGKAKVEFEGEIFYINKEGRIVEPEGELFPIKIKEKYGYIDREFNLVIAPQFDFALPFSEGQAAVKIGNKWGYINQEGKFTIALKFDYADNFSEGLAVVKVDSARPGKWNYCSERVKISDIPFGRWGYIDKKGNFVIEPKFDTAFSFSEGLARVRIGNSWGYIDTKGNFVIEPFFNEASDFSQGKAIVKLLRKKYYINKKGEIIKKVRE